MTRIVDINILKISLMKIFFSILVVACILIIWVYVKLDRITETLERRGRREFSRVWVEIDLECWGLAIIIFKNAEIELYKYTIDIHILCADIMIRLIKREP